MKCLECNSQMVSLFNRYNWKIDKEGREFTYIFCNKCQITFCNPMPTQGELNLFYAEKYDYSWYAKRKYLKQLQAYHRWLSVKGIIEKNYKNKGELLDIGCGHGWFLEAARDSGWDAVGVEQASLVADEARKKLGLSVYEGSIDDIDFSYSTFDVITMWHSLEHFANPLNVLKKVKKFLKPDGTVVITIPNFESVGLKIKGVHWVWLQPPFVHMKHFSVKSITKLLEQAGFCIEKIRTRDTWDAQVIYDGFLCPKIEIAYEIIAIFICERILRKFGIKNIKKIKETIYFYFCESTRLLIYPLSLFFSSILKIFKKYSGSEILLIARTQ